MHTTLSHLRGGGAPSFLPGTPAWRRSLTIPSEIPPHLETDACFIHRWPWGSTATVLDVTRGDSAVVRIDDAVAHTVCSTGPDFTLHLRPQPPGCGNAIAFETKDTRQARRAIHPTTKRTVTVARAPS